MGSAGASPCNLSDPRCNLSCNLSELGGGYPAGGIRPRSGQGGYPAGGQGGYPAGGYAAGCVPRPKSGYSALGFSPAFGR